MTDSPGSAGLEIAGAVEPGFDAVLSEEALAFVAALAGKFSDRVEALLAERTRRQAAINDGRMPDFLEETRDIRKAEWRIAPAPEDLRDRRVEITGPPNRKMIINGLNSGARVFMADFEDALSPTWQNIVHGQANLRDAVRRSIELESGGKHYRLKPDTATLIVRPRGWQLPEKHLRLEGRPVPGALVDFGLYLFHNAAELKRRGTGPYFYLPKLESHEEARLWNEIFRFAEASGVVDPGAIKVTVLIETILAAFEMDEILYELKDYIVGLNCGRWDYIFSFIRTFQRYPQFVLPDRSEVTMTRHFLRSCSRLLVRTCHRRGAWAIGGMAAQIPIKDDPGANRDALAIVRADKEREVADGHDGTWIAHPGLVPLAGEVFEEGMAGTGGHGLPPEEEGITADDLLQVPKGRITEAGLRNNIAVVIRYMAAWMSGNGCVPINNLMEDAATAEIARAQLWQWVHHETGVLDEGRVVTTGLFRRLLDEELAAITEAAGAANGFESAAALLERVTTRRDFTPFLTLEAYEALA